MNCAVVISLVLVAFLLDYLAAKPYHIKDGDVDILVTQDNETGNYEFQ